ncbi:MAG: TRL-like family protein [Leptospiraceae bacterium]|nr:TRL-like family protein [Leptospiraceae bacterium]
MVFLLFLFSNCTGGNILTSFYIGKSTHPLEDHDNPAKLAMKGGLIYYKNNQVGQTGGIVETSEKKGEACATSYGYLLATGDASLRKAMRDGNITKIKQVNHFVTAFLGFVYHKHCTIVIGE